jgi:hypothetical protein
MKTIRLENNLIISGGPTPPININNTPALLNINWAVQNPLWLSPTGCIYYLVRPECKPPTDLCNLQWEICDDADARFRYNAADITDLNNNITSPNTGDTAYVETSLGMSGGTINVPALVTWNGTEWEIVAKNADARYRGNVSFPNDLITAFTDPVRGDTAYVANSNPGGTGGSLIGGEYGVPALATWIGAAWITVFRIHGYYRGHHADIATLTASGSTPITKGATAYLDNTATVTGGVAGRAGWIEWDNTTISWKVITLEQPAVAPTEIFSVILGQSGIADPFPDVVYNNTGETFTFTRTGVGTYLMTTTWLMPSRGIAVSHDGGVSGGTVKVGYNGSPFDRVIRSYDAAGVLSDNILNDTSVTFTKWV